VFVTLLRACAIAVTAAVVPASAQVVSDPPPRAAASTTQDPAAKRWELDLHGGLSHAVIPTGGRSALPQPGPPIPTSSPTFSTRAVPSWFFGDGAAILNDVNALFGLPERVMPLDAALESLGLEYRTRATAGARVRRDVTSRYAVELSVDLLAGSADLDDALLAAVPATRDSFAAAWAALLDGGPFTDRIIETDSATHTGSNRELAITAAAQRRFTTAAGFVPYVTFGGGILTGTGDLPSLTLTANYRFTILDEVPIDETDSVTIRYTTGTAFVGVLGGGVRRSMGAGWGLQADGRVLIGPQRTRLLLDAQPEVVVGTPADSIETVTNPSIQFSNDPSIGRTSTLSGSLDGFEAFKGSGVQTRVLITFGVFLQF
jgi:hypothetical protein